MFGRHLFGLRIVIDDTLGRAMKSKQVRFPRSKKKRIRKKWSKQPGNFDMRWHTEPVCYQYDGMLVMNSLMKCKILKEQNAND